MTSSKSLRQNFAPAIALFFVAPLIAEFLLGNLPIQLLPALVVLAPLYGGGALLIREVVRRTNHGWPTILLLGIVYAIIEEAFTTQSLFNPDYLRLKLHLLDPAYIPALGISAWWTLWMFNVHPVWSIATPIALIEATVPERAEVPWLGRAGLSLTIVLFAFGLVASTALTLKQDPFVASHLQFAAAAVICIVLAVLALLLPRRRAPHAPGSVPNPILVGCFALAIGSITLLIPKAWGWGAAGALLCCDVAVLAAVFAWSRRQLWSIQHKLALAAGAALAYTWHAFVQVPVVPGSVIVIRIGNALFALGCLCLIWFAAKRSSRWLRSAPI